MKKYLINEIFYSIQGEGVRAGTANVFVRFAHCNLACKMETHGFDCDTEFSSSRAMTAEDIAKSCRERSKNCRWIVCTGGEPALQLDRELLDAMHAANFNVAIETNGTHDLPHGIEWVCVSPKTAEHCLRVLRADEVKYVRHHGQGIPKPVIDATHYLLSPAFDADGLPEENLRWCLQLVKENPTWRLSVQQHRLLGVR